MKDWVHCAGCGGGGSDDRPPYVGVCRWCGGSGILKPWEYEEMLIADQFHDILQNAYEEAQDLWIQAQDDKTDMAECLHRESDFIQEVVISWWKQLGADEGYEYAVDLYKKHQPASLQEMWILEHEPVGP